MKIGEWIIPKEYKRVHSAPGSWEGNCVYVLAWDKENKIIYANMANAYAYTKRITDPKPIIVTASSKYYSMIMEMVPFDEEYKIEADPIEMHRTFIEYIFRIKAWWSILK